MLGKQEWLRKNRTIITAAVCTVALFGAVFLHYLQPGRCVVALVFCWALASHSQDVNDHKAEIVLALERGAKAGLELRAGAVGPCVEDLTVAGKTALQVTREIEGEHKAEEAAT